MPKKIIGNGMEMGQLNNFVLVQNTDGTYTVDGSWVTDGTITPAKLNNGAALSVLGRSANSAGVRADIAGANVGEYLQVLSGPTVGFAAPAPNDVSIDPMTLSPYLYLSADSGVYKDAGTTLAANTDTVQQWNDLSGNGRHFSQATAGKRPQYQTTGVNTLNGLPSIFFNGAHCMQRASVALTSFTIMVLFKNVSTGGKVVYEQSADINANNGALLYTTLNSSIAVKKGGVISSANSNSGWGETGHWLLTTHMYSVEGTQSRHQIMINDYYGAPAPVVVNNPGIGSVTDTINIGSRNNAASLLIIGSYCMFLIFTPAISYEKWRGVAKFFQRKWDI